MDKDYFLKLLHKYQQGNATNEERKFLEDYYNLFQTEPGISDMLSMEEKKEVARQINENIWNNISKAEQATPKIRFINRRGMITERLQEV